MWPTICFFWFYYHINYVLPLVEPNTMAEDSQRIRANGPTLRKQSPDRDARTSFRNRKYFMGWTGLFMYFNGTSFHNPFTTLSSISFLITIHVFSFLPGWLANSSDESPKGKSQETPVFGMPHPSRPSFAFFLFANLGWVSNTLEFCVLASNLRHTMKNTNSSKIKVKTREFSQSQWKLGYSSCKGKMGRKNQ